MRELFFYGHGKLLVSGEYFILDGAKGLCLPTNVGQTLAVKYKRSSNPHIHWKSYDHTGALWYESTFDRWKLESIDNKNEVSEVLSKILKQARKQNIHFLREDYDIFVETHLEFPIDWGLGSSSSLIYNIAQWAYVSQFELLVKSFGGSGYDIACAQSMGPITYQNIKDVPNWTEVPFNPHFKSQIYFLYLNKKQSSREEVKKYNDLMIENKKHIIEKITKLTNQMLECVDLNEFEQIVFEHENIISKALDRPRIQDELFQDFWGSVKSLGAWGGDFAMVTSQKSYQVTREYFVQRGFETLIPYHEIIREESQIISKAPNQILNEINVQ